MQGISLNAIAHSYSLKLLTHPFCLNLDCLFISNQISEVGESDTYSLYAVSVGWADPTTGRANDTIRAVVQSVEGEDD